MADGRRSTGATRPSRFVPSLACPHPRHPINSALPPQSRRIARQPPSRSSPLAMSTSFPPLSPSLPSSFQHASSGQARRTSAATTTATSSRNPISLRLYKVLASSFDDPSSREALETVSDFYVGGPGAAQAVEREGPGGEEGAAERARRNLRRDGEEKLAEGSRRFLAAFGDVDKVSHADETGRA